MPKRRKGITRGRKRTKYSRAVRALRNARSLKGKKEQKQLSSSVLSTDVK